MASYKNPFAYDKNGNLIYIKNKDYENKNRYIECYCPKCNEKLVAKMGNMNIWHFAHKINTNCDGNYESFLHQYAKNVIKNNTNILLPDIEIPDYLIMHNMLTEKYRSIFSRNYTLILAIQNKLTSKKSKFFYKNIYSYKWVNNETKISEFKPDCIVKIKDKPLCIEIKVTHGCNEEKINKVKKSNIDMIEIDLSSIYSCLDENEFNLDEYILKHASRKWIYKTRLNKLENDLFKELVISNQKYIPKLTNNFCEYCGEVFEENDYENLFFLTLFKMDKECFKENKLKIKECN